MKEDLDLDPVVSIDRSLAAVPQHYDDETTTDPEFIITLCTAICRQLQLPAEESVGDVVGSALAVGRNARDREFVVACLLRLMAADDGYFSGKSSFAVLAMQLLDDTRAAPLYKELGLRPEDQTYEKVRKLRTVVTDLETDAQAALKSFASLSHVGAVHRKLMKLLNDRRSYPIRSFVPTELLQNKLSVAVSDVEEYLSSEGRKTITSYDNAKSSLGDLADTCHETGTCYSLDIFGKFAAIAEQYIDAHFSSGSNSERPIITLRPISKRYPFHVADALLRLSFVVSNSSGGRAYDLSVAIVLNSDLTIRSSEHFLGSIGPNDELVVSFDAVVTNSLEACPTIVTVKWTTYDGTEQSLAEEFELPGQVRHIDWESLETEEPEPYSLEPVDSEEDLVGRDQVLHDLMRRTKAQSVSSS